MLVAFAGFAGAGKTTAIEYLQQQGLGRRVYLGEAVFDEIDRRGLMRTPEVERAIRIELRSSLGPSAFADLRVSRVTELIGKGECALIDAIFMIEEYRRLESCSQVSVLVAIEASFETRSRRLKVRSDRGYTADELLKRDKTEREELGTASVLKVAQFTILNEGVLTEFYGDVTALWKRISS
jgi:dephospho-CoA kinase